MNTSRRNNLINKWAYEMNRLFSKEVQMANKFMKKCFANKITLRFNFTRQKGCHQDNKQQMLDIVSGNVK
jgi:hypothetical protein